MKNICSASDTTATSILEQYPGCTHFITGLLPHPAQADEEITVKNFLIFLEENTKPNRLKSTDNCFALFNYALTNKSGYQCLTDHRLKNSSSKVHKRKLIQTLEKLSLSTNELVNHRDLHVHRKKIMIKRDHRCQKKFRAFNAQMFESANFFSAIFVLL